MQAAKKPGRGPRLVLVPLRIALITVLITLLSFAVSLLLGILGTVITATVHGTPPDMKLAYRYIALPTAAVVGAIALVTAVIVEVRHYRQAKALAEIERAG
jgi:uncharacterized BrkB/YihY/UPF0761 family membrane protein